MPWWAIFLIILASMVMVTVGTVWVAFMWNLFKAIKDKF